MYKAKMYLFLVTCSLTSLGFAQETSPVSGKISTSGQLLKNIKVTNLHTRITTYSDEEGRFNIPARKKDSILFSSDFFEEKVIMVRPRHFREELHIDLTEKVNQLDEVIVEDKYIAPDFDEKAYSSGLQKQIAEDMKNDPLKYMSNTSGNMDFVLIFNLIYGLFKKDKQKEAPPKTIVYEDLDNLFKSDPFFTEKLLTNELKIPRDYRGLFLVYCESRKIDAGLLAQDNRFDLLNALILHSKEFLYSVDNADSEP
ncbi:hypothetical protein [Sinomicrobium sp. M5D2P9]